MGTIRFEAVVAQAVWWDRESNGHIAFEAKVRIPGDEHGALEHCRFRVQAANQRIDVGAMEAQMSADGVHGDKHRERDFP